MNRGPTLRRVASIALGAVCATVLAFPAGATMPDEDGDHTVTICHVTNGTNEWVVIDVDVAAFDGEGDSDHRHHVSNDGRTDFLAPASGVCDDGGGGTL